MNVGVLFSGGKDSCLAIQRALDAGYTISCLISIKSKNIDSWMFHTPNIDFIGKQAEAMDVPMIVGETEGVKENEINDLKETIKIAKGQHDIEGVVTGAISSTYQASRIQRVCHELSLYCFNPLWLTPQEDILKELIESGYEVIVTRVAGEGLTKKWLGRKIDSGFVKDIFELREKYKLNVAGEGGEMESFVLDAPFFKDKLFVEGNEIVGNEGNYVYLIKKIGVEEK